MLGNCNTGRKIMGQISITCTSRPCEQHDFTVSLLLLVLCHRACDRHSSTRPLRGCKHRTTQQGEAHNLNTRAAPSRSQENIFLGRLVTEVSVPSASSPQASTAEKSQILLSHTRHASLALVSAPLQLLVSKPRRHSALLSDLYCTCRADN